MKDIRKIIAGRQAKRNGENFENILHAEAYRTGWTVIKIPMGAKMVSAQKMIRLRTDFDFIFVRKKDVIFIDSKTTKAKSFAFSSITEHQAKILKELDAHGHKAGYIVNFTEHKKTVFFTGKQIWSAQCRGSLKPEDGILIGENRIINLSRIFQDSTMTHGSVTIP